MSILGRYALGSVAATIAFVTLAIIDAQAGEKRTINAFSVWEATGQTFRTGEKVGTLVGVLRGLLFIESEQGPQRIGTMACPLTLNVNVETGEQDGVGKCTITANDGPLVFADVSCRGFHLIGCRGSFNLRGGTERFSGITGGGPVTFRSDAWTITSLGEFETARKAEGIAYWRNLEFELPDK